MAGFLKERQIEAIKCMLNFNSSPTASDVPQWKVLIYDEIGRDIIAPLLSVKELRNLGVTLHLPISRELLEQLAQTALSEDCVQQISRVFDQYTNFVCLEDDLLELRPITASTSPTYYALNRSKATDTDIASIVDATVDSLFSVFATLGSVPIIRCPRGDASELIAAQLESRFRDSLRDSRNTLFAGFDAARGGGGGSASRDTRPPGSHGTSTSAQGSMAPASNLFQRPLLILLDRNLDLATPLHHELNIRLNRVEVDLNLAKEQPIDDATGQPAVNHREKPARLELYDLNTTADRLWRDFKGAAFADVAEAIREEVGTLRDYEQRMGELKSSMGLSGDLGSVDESTLTLLDDNTARLTNAVSSLPQLMERKRCLDMHTNIATCLANVISRRQLHVIAEEEDKLLTRQTSADSNIADLLRNPSVGSPEDKLRLLLFTALLRTGSVIPGGSGGGGTGGSGTASSSVGGTGGLGSAGQSEFCLADSELTQLKGVLREACPELDLGAVDYVQQLRRMPRLGQLGESSSMAGYAGMRANSSRSMLNKLVSHGSAMLLTSMRHFMGQKMKLPLTRIVSLLMDNKGGNEVDDYLYFDPKLHRRQSNDIPRFKHPFCEAFVFVVGGGSYVEYHDLQQFARVTSGSSAAGATGATATATSASSSNLTGLVNGSGGPGDASGSLSGSASAATNAKRVIYGCTELLSPGEFLAQLTTLGKEIS